jgi:hypothetical protein
MQAPTSTGAPSSAAARCLEKNLVSKDERAVSPKRNGRLCWWINILATFPGKSCWAISGSLMITGPGAQKTIVGPFARDHRLCRGLSCIEWIRYAYHIPAGCPERAPAAPTGQRGDGRYSAKAAADLLNVDGSTIADWCKIGRLESVRSTPLGPRWITLTPEIITALRKPVKRTWKQRHPRNIAECMLE